MNKINDILKQQGRKQKWLAEQMGVHRSTVWRWCKSGTGFDTLFEISKLLKTNIINLRNDENRIINNSDK